MNVLEMYKEDIAIDETIFHEVVIDVYKASFVHNQYKSANTIHKKEELNDTLIGLFEKIIKYNLTNKKMRAEIIDILTKMYIKREMLEIMEGKVSQDDLREASARLAEKSQSTFKKT